MSAVVAWPDVVRRRLAIPETQVLVCGIGLVRTSRVPVEDFATFHQ